MTVGELLHRITSAELSEWMEFWTLEAADRKRPPKPPADDGA